MVSNLDSWHTGVSNRGTSNKYRQLKHHGMINVFPVLFSNVIWQWIASTFQAVISTAMLKLMRMNVGWHGSRIA